MRSLWTKGAQPEGPKTVADGEVKVMLRRTEDDQQYGPSGLEMIRMRSLQILLSGLTPLLLSGLFPGAEMRPEERRMNAKQSR